MRQSLVLIPVILIILSLAISLVACKGESSDNPIPTSAVFSVSPNGDSTQPVITFPNASETVTLAIEIDPEGAGNTSPFPPGESEVPIGQVREIRAISAYGYEFVAWDGDVSDSLSPTTSVTLNQDTTITALFRSTGTPLSTRDIPNLCEQDRDAIQSALDSFHEMHGEWPTLNGEPGDIEWDQLVPEWLDAIPQTDEKCEWQVDDDPVGKVCLLTPC